MLTKLWYVRGGLVGLLLLGFIFTAALAVAAPQIVAVVLAQANPNGVWYNPLTNRTYVTNSSSDSVTVINGLTNTALANIAVGSDPIGIGVNPTTNRIYVANQISNNISVIDGVSNSVVATVTVGSGPVGAVVNPTTNRIYVPNFDNGTISVINGADNTVLTTLNVGGNPYGTGVNPTTNRIYMGNYNETITVIDSTNNTIIATVPVGTSPNSIGVNPITNRIYVPNTGSNNLTVIDGTTNNVITTINVGNAPTGASVNPNTNRIYVTNGGSNTISIIDGSSNTILFTIPVDNPADLVVNPALNRIYISNYSSQTVTVLSDPVPPTISKTFGAGTINLNDTTTLSFTINNSNPLDKLTGIGFVDNLPDGLQLTATSPANNCGGTLNALSSSTQIKLAGGTLDGGKSCTIKVEVKATTSGEKRNTTEPISATESGAGKASNTAVLTVKAAGPIGQLRFAHLAPYTGKVDIYVNREIVLKNVAYGTVSPYLPFKPGNYAIDIVKAGANLNNTEPLISEAVDLWENEHYTYAALNYHEDTSAFSYFYKDDLTAPSTGKAKIKVLHASPDAGAVEVALQGGPVLFSTLNAGESSEYLEVAAGTYNLEMREPGTGKVLYKLPPVNLAAGTLYTAVAEGLVNSSPAFKVDLIPDVNF
jgi:YVTN family beta-propeller protein